MQPVQNGWYCMQCAQYSADRDCCSQDGHDRVFLLSEGSVSDNNLKSLLVSLFAAYEDRPCLGIPYGKSAEWEWLSYSELKSHVMAYVLSLRRFQDRFLVAAFPENCLELIAFDLAAALLGACSVIAHGETHAHDIVTLLGQENCKIVDKPPPTVQLQTDSLNECFWNAGDEEVLFSLFATSGSVGSPKLVKRTRSSWFETVRDTVQFSNHLCVTLNFTSLAHSASRTELWWNLACGGQTAFANRQLKFLDSLTELAPTEVAAPPAVWTEIRHDLTSQGILDFKTLKCNMERLLRNLHTVSTGTAPCEPGLFTFLKTIFGGDGDIAVFNHYGATEIGSIALDGKLNEDLDVKLLEIPEHGIYSPQGELCIRVHSKDSRNGCIFEGYYSEDQCKQAMTEDGYYRTGDIAERIGHGDGNREIRIVGRLSNMVKLSDGKFQSLESMDTELLGQLQALQNVTEFAEVEVPEIPLVQVCTLEILGSLAAVVYAQKLHKLPLALLGVPCLWLEEPLTVENGMLTPSLKLCRHRVLAKYEHELRRLIESTPCIHGYPQSTQSNHSNGDDKVTELLAAIAPGITSAGFDESRALRDFGVTSIHFARIAAALNIPVHVLAQNSTLRDLKCFTDGLGVKAAEADIQLCIEQWSAIQQRQLPVEPSPCKSAAWKTVMVTGATGNIGSCFVELLQRRGLNVIPVARSLGHDIGQPELGMSKKDYAQCEEADAVIHCAAIVNWNTAYMDLREANVLSALHLARLCVVGRPKQLLFVGSGVAFPEEPPTLDWLQECLNPYVVSKIASEYLIRKLHPQTVVVRAGIVVWHSTTGAHNPSDAYLRLIQSIKGDSLVWQYDDFLDGMNVDAFCRAAYSLFERGAFGTYNLRGSYDLSRLLPLFEPLPKRVPYAEWYETIKTLAERSALNASNASNVHPLTALFSHIDNQCPPFTVDQSPEVEHYLTKKCAEALGSKLAQAVVEVSGYTAFLEALKHAEKTAKGTELQGERHRRNSKFFSAPLSERIV